jgi:hypothetical protein
MRHGIAATAALLLVACGGQSDGGNDSAGEAADGGGAAAAAFQPGLWEITTQVLSMSGPSIPQGVTMPTPPPTTVRTCMTPEQAGQPGAGFFTGSGESGGCTYENNSVAGGRIAATVQCNNEGGTMRSTMNGQFTATSFEVNQQVETSAQGVTMNIESRTNGRRVGDCPST